MKKVLFSTIFFSSVMVVHPVLYVNTDPNLQVSVRKNTSSSSVLDQIREGLREGFANLAEHKKKEKERNALIDKFIDAGYTFSESVIYADLVMNDPSGYMLVLEHIQRDKELQYHYEMAQKLAEQKINARRDLFKLYLIYSSMFVLFFLLIVSVIIFYRRRNV